MTFITDNKVRTRTNQRFMKTCNITESAMLCITSTHQHCKDNQIQQWLTQAFQRSFQSALERKTADSLQCVLNAAFRVISETLKFDRGLTHLLHCELHWLDVPQRIQFKLGVTVHLCLQGNVPKDLVDCCKSITDVASRQRLRSTSRHQLIVSRHCRTKFGCRTFSVASPTAWNSLPDYLRDPSLSEDTYRQSLKAYLFALY